MIVLCSWLITFFAFGLEVEGKGRRVKKRKSNISRTRRTQTTTATTTITRTTTKPLIPNHQIKRGVREGRRRRGGGRVGLPPFPPHCNINVECSAFSLCT